MSPTHYPAALVREAVNSLMTETQTAYAQLGEAVAELDRVKAAAAAGAPKVVLQKVAANTLPLDRELLKDTLDQLVDAAILPPENREKMASRLAADPNSALQLVQRVINISAGAPQEGAGLRKASDTSEPDDLSELLRQEQAAWQKVLTHGA